MIVWKDCYFGLTKFAQIMIVEYVKLNLTIFVDIVRIVQIVQNDQLLNQQC